MMAQKSLQELVDFKRGLNLFSSPTVESVLPL